MLLAAGPLDLGDEKLQDIVLESPAGQRRRIDVEVGFTVFEVKRDLRTGNVRDEAVGQLAGYVADRVSTMQQRYVGVLTDGAEWHLYHLAGSTLTPVSSFFVDARSPDVDGLCVWLEGVLATAEKITPTPHEIAVRLGADSPAHALDISDLTALYEAHRALPTVKLKRELWAKLLTTALGTAFSDEDRLFVEHTLLVTTAEIISHALVGFDLTDPSLSAAILVRGGMFSQAQITGVVEQDFFDWVVEVPGGAQFVRTLARNLSRFAWELVEHDVMKVLYESVISAQERHRLGEYYTPDWLADEIASVAVKEPLNQRVLDPACGSGTFLFHAVRRYLAAAQDNGATDGEAILGATNHITGVDVHPVAVTFARVTYLLAIGMRRLQAPDRPALTVPVYLGDSVQWGQKQTLLNAHELSIPTDDGAQIFASELVFPERLLSDAGRFDELVSELADKASAWRSGVPIPSLAATFRRFAVHQDDQLVLTETFKTMCRLHDEGRNHIWGYYVRNLARPLWLSQIPHRVDVLMGNPPWLSYRAMPASTQASFRAMSKARSLWEGATVAPSQDLSGLFVARCTELYLRDGGRFAFVMPLGALSRRTFKGFREGSYPAPIAGPPHRLRKSSRARRAPEPEPVEPVHLAFEQPWDLHGVKPSFFPVPASVVFGTRVRSGAVPLKPPAVMWSGRLPVPNSSRAVAAEHLKRSDGVAIAPGSVSPYQPRFAEGATVVPRFLFMVESGQAPVLGAGAGRQAVRSFRTPSEKRPWRDLPSLEGTVESAFVRPLYLGDTLLPFRSREPRHAVIPWDGKVLLRGDGDQIDNYPGLAKWWRQAGAVWMAHRSSDRLTLTDRLNFRHGLTDQFPAPQHRVVYSASGMYLAAMRVSDPRAVIEHKLYWGAAADLQEARYLTAILNSDIITERVRPLQARGEHNPRDFDKYIFQLPIPLYEPTYDAHRQLVDLAKRAEEVAQAVELPSGVAFQALRRRIRAALADDGVGRDINDLTEALLSRPTGSG